MIEFHDVQKYYGKFHALKDINLTIDAGETVVLIGPSGSGKSSLIRTICILQVKSAEKCNDFLHSLAAHFLFYLVI